MEYMVDTLSPYKNLKKRDLILFPHRIAPEKQVEIFRDLAKELPEYEFVVCQDTALTKHEYHTLLGQAKIVFSANLQETLGISCYEGALVGAIPVVPDRLSYTEMYDNWCKYPSEFTENWDSYIANKKELVNTLREHMNNYNSRIKLINQQAKSLTSVFFSAENLLKNIR
jgi:glycosyltransferase involved in cell wall biosynthesis